MRFGSSQSINSGEGSQVQADREMTEQAAVAAQLLLDQQKAEQKAKLIKYGMIGAGALILLKILKSR